MGTSLYDQYLQETGGPTKPPPSLPAPPPIAAPDVTRVAPRPPAEPPSEPFIQKVARVNKAVRKALPLTGPLEQLETGAKKVGEEQGKFLLAQNPGKMPRAQDYPDAESYSKAFADYSQRYVKGMTNVAATTGTPEGAGEAPEAPFPAYSRLERAVTKAPFETGTAEQWKAALTPNVPAGERQYRGVDQLLEANAGKTLTKAQINEHLKANPTPKIGESRYGGKPKVAVQPIEWDTRYKTDDGHDMWTADTNAGSVYITHGTAARPEGPPPGRPYALGFDDDTEQYFPTLDAAQAAAHERHAAAEPPVGNNGIPIGWEIRPMEQPLNRPGQLTRDVDYHVIDPNGRLIRRVQGSWDTALAEARKLAGVDTENPRAKFSQYKEPGGTNYSENVLTLQHRPPPPLVVPAGAEGYRVREVKPPNQFTGQRDVELIGPNGRVVAQRFNTRATDAEVINQHIASDPTGWVAEKDPEGYARDYRILNRNGEVVTLVAADSPDQALQVAHATAEARAAQLAKPKPFVQPAHFPDENPLVHYRHTDHILPNGEKVRFLEEIQSDWHQKLRQRDQARKELATIKPQIETLRANMPHAEAGGQAIEAPGTAEWRREFDRLSRRENELNSTLGSLRDIPDAPFHKTEEWTELALKDAINKAHKDGIDRIAWTTGDQQAARYDLSKHVDLINYDPETSMLGAYQDDHPVHQGQYDQRALPDVIGKEAAENLLKPENWDARGGVFRLEGEGLKVGGAGMRAYYDKLVPKVVQDYGKKMGVKLQIEPVNIFHEATGGYEGPEPTAARVQAALQRELVDPDSDGEDSPIYMQLVDMQRRIENGHDPRAAVEASLSDLRSDMGGGVDEADMVAHALGGKYTPPTEPATNQSFSLHPLRDKGPQPLWAAGAAGVAGAAALQQGGDDKNKGGDLYKQFQAEQQKQEPQSLYEQYQAEQEAAKPKPSIWDRLKSINAGVRQALVPDALQQIETGAAKFGKDQGQWGVQLAKDLSFISDPKNIPDPSKPSSPEMRAAERRVLAALATIAMPAALHQYAAELLAVRGIRAPVPVSAEAPPVSPSAATTERAPWDRSATAPPPVDQPQPLRPEQQVLRNRLATEGINPSGAIKRRPTMAPPPVEPPPEAQTFSTKGAVRRPAPAAPPVEAAAPPEAPPVERRAENPPDRVVWSPEERARYITASQKEYAAKINKPWSQWTPEEKVGYFADQQRMRASAPWQPPAVKNPPVPEGNPDEIPTIEALKYAREKLGIDGFREAAAKAPPSGTGTGTISSQAGRLERVAREIVRADQGAVSWPPPPAEGAITPVVSSNSEFAARPGVMRAVNRGEQPAALNSPLRLPEPTPEDRAIVQPKGVKEISPEEVAARKPPEPVVQSTPKVPQPATVDENGLFFDHRTPKGELRDFRRVSTEGLIKAHREMQDQIQRDQQLAIYRSVENENMSGTGDRTVFTASTRTGRGTSQQAEAAERLRNYGKVMDRLDAELKNRGMSSDDVYNAIQQQEEHEAAIEQEAIHHNDAESAADDAFNFDDMTPEEGTGSEAIARRKAIDREPPISDVLNVAKLNLGSKTAEQRMAAKLEEFRAQRDANKQTFSEADVNRNEILNELRAGDPLALPTEKAKKLSGEQLLARRDLVRENDQTIASLSKQMEAGMPPEAYSQAAALVQRAVEHNDALLSDLVTGSSQKGRDLNLLRRMANNSLDPAVWRVQAKRMLGDRPLTAEIDAAIRKLAQEAEDACQ